MGCGGSANRSRVVPAGTLISEAKEDGGATFVKPGDAGTRVSTPSTTEDCAADQVSLPSVPDATGGTPCAGTATNVSTDAADAGAGAGVSPVSHKKRPQDASDAKTKETSEMATADSSCDRSEAAEVKSDKASTRACEATQVEPVNTVAPPQNPEGETDATTSSVPVAESADAAIAASTPNQSQDDPIIAKLITQLAKLEGDVSDKIGSAGPMQKRAWRNKVTDLTGKVEEAFAGVWTPRKGDIKKRLDAVSERL